MTKHWLNKKVSWGLNLSLLALILVAVASCNKDFEDKLDLSSKKDSITGFKERKVLYVMINGTRGLTLSELQPPTITDIATNSLQSFNSVSDPNGLPATTITDMLTGVNKLKHKVTSADFAGNDLAKYPIFFKQIKAKDAKIRTAAFTSTPAISQHLITNADVNQNFPNDDAAVKNAMLTELKSENAGVVLAEFSSVDNAGKQFGYDASIENYRNAILTIDIYLKEALTAIKERANYESEDWLVVVASNQGGDFTLPPSQVDGSLYSKPLLNGFTFFYNPRFSYQFYGKPVTTGIPYEGKAVNYSASSIFGRIPVADAAIYNFGTTGDYTVQVKIRINANSGTLNPAIIAKSDNTGNSTAGWSFLLVNANKRWRMQLTNSSNSVQGAELTTNTWYTLTGKIYMEGATRKMKVFTDGVLDGERVVTATGTSTTAPLNVGNSPSYGGGNAKINVTDIRIYNEALPDSYIMNNYCKPEIKPGEPYYSNLIGYWPATDGIGNQLVDRSPNKRNFVLSGAYAWSAFNEVSTNVCVELPEDIYKRVPNGIDIPSFIYGWMGISSIGLNLDGRPWIPVYSDVKP